MHVPVLAWLVLAAFVAGAVDAVAGGSGLIALPALLAAGLPPHAALGTNKAQGVFGTFAATLRYARAGLLDRPRARVTFPPGLAGSLCGAALVLLVPPSALRPVVLVLLVAVALALALRPSRVPGRTAARIATTPTPTSLPLRWPRLAAGTVAFVLGAYDGFFGPGAGTFLIFAFAWLFDLSLRQASADSKPVNFASNLAAVAMFSARGAVVWQVALPMAVAQFAGGWLGAHVAVRGGDRVVRVIVLLVVVALVLKLAIDLRS